MNDEMRGKISLKLDTIESLILSDTPLVQRAALQLLTNLIFCPSVFNLYADKPEKLVVVVALTDGIKRQIE